MNYQTVGLKSVPNEAFINPSSYDKRVVKPTPTKTTPFDMAFINVAADVPTLPTASTSLRQPELNFSEVDIQVVNADDLNPELVQVDVHPGTYITPKTIINVDADVPTMPITSRRRRLNFTEVDSEEDVDMGIDTDDWQNILDVSSGDTIYQYRNIALKLVVVYLHNCQFDRLINFY